MDGLLGLLDLLAGLSSFACSRSTLFSAVASLPSACLRRFACCWRARRSAASRSPFLRAAGRRLGGRRADQSDPGGPLLACQPPLLDRLGHLRVAGRRLERFADAVEDLGADAVFPTDRLGRSHQGVDRLSLARPGLDEACLGRPSRRASPPALPAAPPPPSEAGGHPWASAPTSWLTSQAAREGFWSPFTQSAASRVAVGAQRLRQLVAGGRELLERAVKELVQLLLRHILGRACDRAFHSNTGIYRIAGLQVAPQRADTRKAAGASGGTRGFSGPPPPGWAAAH